MRGSIAGLELGGAGSGAAYRALLSVLDLVLSLVVVGTAVVTYWRSVWELINFYTDPDDVVYSAFASTVVGFGGNIFFVMLQTTFERYLHPDKNRICYYVFSRLYSVCFAFVCVNQWRGPWILLDVFTETQLFSAAISVAVGGAALTAIRGLKNCAAPPICLCTDFVDGYFQVKTMFKVTMMQGTSWYILDCLFSVIVVGTLVVLVWRGVWVLMDIYIYPDEPTWSAWGSTIIGYSIVAVAFSLQPLMRWVCDRIDGCWRLLACDLFLLFALVGTVNVWRGIWLLLNFYFLPDDLELSCWITHWTSLVLLILMGCSNSLLVRGVFIDAEEPAGKCVVFPCYYLRLIFQQERERKKQAQIELMAQRKLEMEKSNHHNPVRINMDANNHM